MTANTEQYFASTSAFYLGILSLFLTHPVIQSSYLPLSWGRRKAVCSSDSREPEALQRKEHWPARRQAGCQQALCRRTVSSCEETHRYERTGPVRWSRVEKMGKMTVMTKSNKNFVFLYHLLIKNSHIFNNISCSGCTNCMKTMPHWYQKKEQQTPLLYTKV